MYYKVPEKDLFELEKAAYILDCLKQFGVDNWVGYPEAMEYMIADEDISESINSAYELCK